MKPRKLIAIVFALAIVLTMVLCAANASAQTHGSVVTIETPGGGRGSGFYVTRNLIMTNAHVVDDRVDGNRVIVMRNYVRYWGQVVAEDTELDLALVLVKRRGPRPFRFCDEISTMDSVKTWVRDYGRFHRVRTKIASVNKNRVTLNGSVIPGNSGSPVVGWSCGKCVSGVVRAYSKGTGRGVAISAIYAQRFLDDYVGGGSK